jgi:endonuclease/exonuclease/phosphatase family metal-dependent hydrolase
MRRGELQRSVAKEVREKLSSESHNLRVATYNVHRCRGLDGRVRPERIVEVLREIDADIVALQEVVSVGSGPRTENQSAFIAEELGLHFRFGSNRPLNGGAYGNVLLSRFPMRAARNYSVSVSGREPRGCLRADIELNESTVLHVFNVHLGTAFLERRAQGKMLVGPEILSSDDFEGPRIVLGDFNEWTRGLTSRLLTRHLTKADLRGDARWGRTYPGVLPLLDLDHVYHDAALEIEQFRPHRSRTALVASDHLPLVANFRLELPSDSWTSSACGPVASRTAGTTLLSEEMSA